ncbi:unnamed protein product [Agarophyton chilense]
MSDASPPAVAPTPSPPALNSARIVIVGAGLSGYVAAAALAQAGCTNISVYDAQPDPTVFEPYRAYSLVIYRSGQRLIERLKGFDAIFKEHAVCQHVRVVNHIAPDASLRVETTRPPAGPVYWLLKTRCLQLLDAFVRERYPAVKLHTGCSVRDIKFGSQGTSLLVDTPDEKGKSVAVDLLLACDGSNSTIRRLMADNDAAIRSTNGMKLYSEPSAATGIRHKGLVISARPIISAPGVPAQVAQPSVIYYIYGQRRGRPAHEAFDMMLLPVSVDSDLPRRAALSVRDGHAILSLRDVSSARNLFRANFPQLRVDDMFSDAALQAFVDTEAAAFPPVQRPNSLVGHFDGGGGVMFVGDAAHSFPPDAAQGVNCAFQDVQHLLEAATADSEAKLRVSDVLDTYETRRDREVWTLMQLVGVAAPHSYRHDATKFSRFMLNKRVRGALAAVAPALFSSDLDSLMRQGLTYGTVRRRNRLTTVALGALVAAIAAVPLALLRATRSATDK